MLDSIERILATLWATFARLDIASASSRSGEIGTGRGTIFGGPLARAGGGTRMPAIGAIFPPCGEGTRGRTAAAEPRGAFFGAMVAGRITWKEAGFEEDDLPPAMFAETGPRSTTVGRGGSTPEEVGFVARAGFARSCCGTGPAPPPARREPCAF